MELLIRNCIWMRSLKDSCKASIKFLVYRSFSKFSRSNNLQCWWLRRARHWWNALTCWYFSGALWSWQCSFSTTIFDAIIWSGPCESTKFFRFYWSVDLPLRTDGDLWPCSQEGCTRSPRYPRPPPTLYRLNTAANLSSIAFGRYSPSARGPGPSHCSHHQDRY